MAKFEVCIIGTREHFFVIDADDEDEAEAIAADLDPGESIRDSHREQQVDWVRSVADDY